MSMLMHNFTLVEKEYKIAQYNLGIFYQNGEGVQKDEIKAFEYYKKLAGKEYINA